jgi:hypothetical protein
VLHRHNQWVKASGRVLDSQIMPGPKAPHPTIITVELHPEGGSPLRAEVCVIRGDRNHWNPDLFYPSVGDVTGFVFDPASGETRIDMTDPRNSTTAHRAAAEAWEARPSDQPVLIDSGPPWFVPARCPLCNKPVNQAMAAREGQPHCMSCGRPLPAYPFLISHTGR